MPIPLCPRGCCIAGSCVCDVRDQVDARQRELAEPLAEMMRDAFTADELARGVPSELAPGWMVDHRVEFPAPPAALVHIVGIDVTIGDVLLRQRCAWCGATLIDYDLTRVAVPIGQEGPPGTWPVGALLMVSGPASWVVEHVDGDPLPPESCTRIDPQVTA